MVSEVRPPNGRTALIVVDVQQRLIPAMAETQRLRFLKTVGNLIALSEVGEWRVVVTEQYKKGLGETLEPIRDELTALTADPIWFEKTTFSAFTTPGFAEALAGIDVVVVIGLETHICVQETALDLLAAGYGVVVPWDGVISRGEEDRSTALALLRERGAVVTGGESLVFAVLRSAQHPSFKEMSARVR